MMKSQSRVTSKHNSDRNDLNKIASKETGLSISNQRQLTAENDLLKQMNASLTSKIKEQQQDVGDLNDLLNHEKNLIKDAEQRIKSMSSKHTVEINELSMNIMAL
jgi:hypothetical protein